MITKISTLADVERFMKQLVDEGTNAHPDDDFRTYVRMETGLASYTTEEAILRNDLMAQCFEVCDAAGADVYSVMQEIFLTETGLDRYIPLPSQVNE